MNKTITMKEKELCFINPRRIKWTVLNSEWGMGVSERKSRHQSPNNYFERSYFIVSRLYSHSGTTKEAQFLCDDLDGTKYPS